MDITIAIGTTDQGRKIHLGYRDSGKLLCAFTGFSPLMSTVVADLPEAGGLEDTIATLLANKIGPSRLCAHCFSVRTRALYAAEVRAARTATS